MEFVDVQIRAWQTDDDHVQVLVHNSPAGDMRKPVTVDYPREQIEQMRGIFGELYWFTEQQNMGRLVELGRALWSVLLPRPVETLLRSSLDRIAPDDGLRVRLCLDRRLIDLPWEYLHCPDSQDLDQGWDDFLFLDSRLSLVREPPISQHHLRPATPVQRMVFAGAYQVDGKDLFAVRSEAEQLAEALMPVGDRLQLDVITSAGDQIEQALMEEAAIFHYAGHTDIAHGRGYLVREVGTLAERAADPEYVAFWTDQLHYRPLDGELLSNMLRRAQTRLAVFNACNSGRWFFAEPIIHSGVAACVGLQGFVSHVACIAFCEKLYSSLINGLSLDEAVTWARLHVLEHGGVDERRSLEWGSFMVYLPTSEVVLFPHERTAAAEADKRTMERTRAQSIALIEVGSALAGAPTIEKRALRKGIIQKLSLDDLRVLCSDVEEALAQDNVEIQVSVDAVGGSGLETKVFEIINYLDKRGYLPYLVSAVRRDWPDIV